MDKSKRSGRALMVSLFIISQLLIISTIGVGEADHGPNAVERGINFKTSFEKLTSLIKLAWHHFKIPDSERIKEGGANAKAAGHAAHEPGEKVKRTIPHHDGQENEL
ncbi:uncharacterized protein LOC122067252 [Macadamia integrifolia]|uniref:uncharacterized protein LOC122067252 n=1 Tax=Macadamia integrifolia TaxID=60698 RepID=UPI001C4F846C|nr:uncharacterized protein LOC122067252 [Macadamia integrifolia]